MRPEPWRPDAGAKLVAGCFVAFARGITGAGSEGDPGWAACVLLESGRPVRTSVVSGASGAPYQSGLLYLRAGPLLEAAIRGLRETPDLLLVNGTGLDHPRRAGLALHLGAVLGVPTVGVTHRPLCARGNWPADERGSKSALVLDDEKVGCWLRTRSGKRPLAVHAAWRTDADTAAAVVVAITHSEARTPEPLRLARQAARQARALDR